MISCCIILFQRFKKLLGSNFIQSFTHSSRSASGCLLCNTLLVCACAESAGLSARSDINKHVLLCHRYSFFVNQNYNIILIIIRFHYPFNFIISLSLCSLIFILLYPFFSIVDWYNYVVCRMSVRTEIQ